MNYSYTPLKIFMIYIIITLVFSFFGPIDYYQYDKLSVLIYMIFFLFLFVVGYLFGIQSIKTRNYQLLSFDSHKMKKILKIVKFMIILVLFVKIIEFLNLILNNSISLSVMNIGQAYVDFYDGYERGHGSHGIGYILMLFFKLPLFSVMTLGIYYFGKLNLKLKISVILIYILIIITETFAQGKQKQLGDILVILLSVGFLKIPTLDNKAKKKIKKFIFLLGIVGIFLLIFVLKLRYEAIGINISNITMKAHPLMDYSTEHAIFKVFGEEWGLPIAIFTSYLTGGYYGLSLALNLPFVWTYFVGNSYATTLLLNKYLDIPIDIKDTYPYRVGIETGWDQSKWHSSFAWFASDFTFVGTLFFFMLVSYMYAKVWKESYLFANPISIIIFTMFNIALLYVPGNNQLLHSPEGVISTFTIILIWVFWHKRYNFKTTSFKVDKNMV